MKKEFIDFYAKDTDLAERFGIARQSVWRWVRDGRLPAPVKLSPGCSRWRLVDVEKWEQSK